MKQFILVFFFLFTLGSFSQMIKGKVVDENNAPLAGANIYFDGTTISTIADDNGNFSLNYASKINSILAISYIGFQTEYITNVAVDKELLIKLIQANTTLKEITVRKDKFTRKQKLQLFREQFLGKTSNAKATKIENEDAIYFDYDSKTKTLKAYSDQPLLIKNVALGYKLRYELVNFEVVFFQETMKSSEVLRSYYAGLSRFEETTIDARTLKKRKKAYQGSQLHFFRNLVNKNWNKDNFLLFKGRYQDNPYDYFNVFDEGDFKKVTIERQVKSFSNKNIVAEFNLLFNKKQQSRITFETETFYVDKFGNNSNIENIIFSGYLSELKVGDMLPINYGVE